MGTTKFLTKYLFPVRSYLVSDTAVKSTFQTLFENALGKTRQLLRIFSKKKNELSSDAYRYQHRLPVEYFPSNPGPTVSVKSKFIAYRPGFIQRVTSKWVSNSLAGTLSKEARKKILQGGSGPMLGFIGFVLAKKPSLLTEEEELEGVSYEIRDAFSLIPWKTPVSTILQNYGSQNGYTFADLKIGDMIAKGCNAAVYSACLLDDKYGSEINKVETEKPAKQQESDSLTCLSKLIVSHSEGEQNVKHWEFEKNTSKENLQSSHEELEPFNLAVKVMFNYSAESNAFAIWRAMYKETLPAIADFSLSEVIGQKVRKKKLKPHPNIVEMYFAFADQLPLLPGAFNNYPQALPMRLLSDGCGRNMTLFLVMKRYNSNLKDYLKLQEPTPRISLLLFTQLLEALVHLLQNDVAHRDLKTDNILLDLSHGTAYPKLVVTDFGCSLECLHLSYQSYDTEKGGNMALMAPEVVNAEVGPFSVIDYSRSDLWTAGSLAYEIYGGSNPFYSSNSNLKNTYYNENDLPPLPANAPPVIQKLVKAMLNPNANQRPSPSLAATVCQVLLHAPPDLLSRKYNKKTRKKAFEWMFLMSAKTYLEASMQNSKPHSLEFELRRTFCSRIQYLEVINAVRYIIES